VQGLLDRGYLAGRSATIDPQRVGEQVVAPGVPPGAKGTRAPDRKPERPGTSHLTIVDADGGIVSMTTSIETAFGSRLMVGGFLLNNHMTDFSFVPETGGRQVVNRIEPGKRPRSSMAPTLVLNGKGMPVLALGSPGGGAIPGYLLKTLVAALDWKLQPQAAIDLPHLFNRNGATELEPGPGTQAVKTALTAMGHQIRVSEQSSGIHAIGWYGGKLVGAADPRREGLALGR
jgi:gamma-glutamyltranspeptidase/glutathione hydrolase